MLNSSFILFLILLSALVISMLFGNSWLLSRKEGFVSFGYTNPNIMNVTISKYSSASVIYLYDNLYFDGKNGNIIEVDSPYCGNVRVNGSSVYGNIACNDSTGSTITQMWITTSSANTTNVNVNSQNANVNQLANIDANPQVSQLVYLSNSQNISSPAGYRYQMFYVSWGTDTYLHILGLDSQAQYGINLKSFYYNMTGSMMRYIDFTSATYIPNYKQPFNSNDHANNSTLYIDNQYSSTYSLYQISKYVKYDISNGFIVIGSPNSYSVYNRSTGANISISSGRGKITSLSSFVSWIVSDGNNGMVIVMAFAYQTVILILNADLNNNYYNLTFCARFTDSALIKSINDVESGDIKESKDKGQEKDKDLPCVDELSCKWYYYFKTIGNNPDVLFKNDFIRKTQIVPPVCPRCPNCPDISGVCNSCGGCGGSGTSSSAGSLVKDTVGGTVGLAKDAVGGTVGLAKDALGGTVGLAKDAVGGTVGLVKDAVGGTVGLVKDAVGGTVGLAKDAVGGTVGLAKDAVGGVARNTAGYGGSGYTPMDNYSAYGALQSKGTNFMPVTASFSAFGK